MYQHTLYRLQQHAVQKLFFLYRPQPLHVDLLGGGSSFRTRARKCHAFCSFLHQIFST